MTILFIVRCHRASLAPRGIPTSPTRSPALILLQMSNKTKGGRSRIQWNVSEMNRTKWPHLFRLWRSDKLEESVLHSEEINPDHSERCTGLVANRIEHHFRQESREISDVLFPNDMIRLSLSSQFILTSSEGDHEPSPGWTSYRDR